jgi:5-methyltetrahydrofolate--homocysteine methyltransferase
MMEGNWRELYDAIVAGDMITVRQKTESEMAVGGDAGRLLKEALVPAMAEVGRRFEGGEYCVPGMLISARAIQCSLDVLRPLLITSGAKSAGNVVIGTGKGDLHDIGKNLVTMMLKGAGRCSARGVRRKIAGCCFMGSGLIALEGTEQHHHTINL